MNSRTRKARPPLIRPYGAPSPKGRRNILNIGEGVKKIDARGAVCPVPTVRVSLALEKMGAGEVLDLLADDPTTRRDLVGWCGEFGHRVLGIFELRKGFRVRIQKHS